MSLLENFERYPLTFGPTPVEPLPRLSEALGGKVEIWAIFLVELALAGLVIRYVALEPLLN